MQQYGMTSFAAKPLLSHTRMQACRHAGPALLDVQHVWASHSYALQVHACGAWGRIVTVYAPPLNELDVMFAMVHDL